VARVGIGEGSKVGQATSHRQGHRASIQNGHVVRVFCIVGQFLILISILFVSDYFDFLILYFIIVILLALTFQAKIKTHQTAAIL
jgi:hypothetical protein